INGLANAKILRPEVERLEKDVVNPFYGFKIYESPDGVKIPVANDAVAYAHWKETIHHMFGGPTPLDRSLTNSMQSLARMAGYDADTRSLYQMSQGLQNLVYSGAMGLRPASAIRQLTQLVPTYADLGAKYTMIGMQKAMEPGGITSLIEKNVLGSPMESLVDAVGVQKGVGRILSKVSEATLYMVSSVDRFTRAATYHGSGAKFDDYLARGAIEKLPFAKKELKHKVLALFNKNQPEKAREAYAFTNVAELQYSFGRANRPQAFRGAVGNLAGMFLSYPLNFAEMAKTFAKRATPEKW